jgi:hypothetical protein
MFFYGSSLFRVYMIFFAGVICGGFASITPHMINFAAPENAAKAPPFETGATFRSPVEIQGVHC